MSETSSEIGELSEMENILQSIGMVSPVTKFSAGRSYHQQLARQLADLLSSQGRLQRMGGMITLTDLYSIYNRARGTELVSPDDLLQAASLMEHLHLGMRLRRFASGVIMIQADSLNEASLCQQLVDLSKSDPEFQIHGIFATDLARKLCISLLVAKEQLLLAEVKGMLCRDDSITGLSFFPNLFSTF